MTNTLRKHLAIALAITLTASVTAAQVLAHDIDDGLELGASLTVSANDPVQATVTLAPRIGFKSALVELPNAVGGAKVVCRLGALVQGQRYTCVVSGTVADDDSGLVIAISGVRAQALPGHDDLTFKSFTVPNPRFDAAAVRATKAAAAKKRGATLESRVKDAAR